MTVGEKIRAIRESKGLTQKQVADACRMADSAIRKYESGTVRPKIGTVTRIADALGVDTMDLTQDDPYYPITYKYSTRINLGSTPEEALYAIKVALYGEIRTRINNALDQLNDDGQQKAVERVEELTEIPKYRRDETQPAPAEKPTEDE